MTTTQKSLADRTLCICGDEQDEHEAPHGYGRCAIGDCDCGQYEAAQIKSLADRIQALAERTKSCSGGACVQGKVLVVSPEPHKTKERDCWDCHGTGTVWMYPPLRLECLSPQCQSRDWTVNASTDALLDAADSTKVIALSVGLTPPGSKEQLRENLVEELEDFAEEAP